MRVGPGLLLLAASLTATPAASAPYVSLVQEASIFGNSQIYDSGQVAGPIASHTHSQTGVNVAAISIGSVGYGIAQGSAYALATETTAQALVIGRWLDEFTFAAASSPVPVTFTLSLYATAAANGPLCGACAFVTERVTIIGVLDEEVRIDNLSPGPAVEQFTVMLSTGFAWEVHGLVNSGATANSPLYSGTTVSSEVDFSTTALLYVDVPPDVTYTTGSGTVYPSTVPEPFVHALAWPAVATLVLLRRVRHADCSRSAPW